MRSHFVLLCLLDKGFKTKRERIAAQGFRLSLDSDVLHLTGKGSFSFCFLRCPLVDISKAAANIGLNEMAREVFYASVTFLF